jgi:hypothetical protein
VFPSTRKKGDPLHVLAFFIVVFAKVVPVFVQLIAKGGPERTQKVRLSTQNANLRWETC